MQDESIDLQRCPNCGSELVKLHKSRTRFWYECDGDCWTQSAKCLTVEKAAESWNSLRPRPKKTVLEVLQSLDIKGMAEFLTSWKNDDFLGLYGDPQSWLESEADSQIEAFAEMEFED